MRFGEAIKSKREMLGLTQQELAEKLFVSRQTVCRWESGSRCPDLVMAKKIALVLGISLDELVPGEITQEDPHSKEASSDFSCIKILLTGIMLLLVGVFLLVADSWNMEIAAFCFIAGIVTFVVGLFVPWEKGNAVVDDALPQKECPQCGKKHDFDYPQCPHCGYSYITK